MKIDIQPNFILKVTYWTNKPHIEQKKSHIEQMSHILNKYPTYWTIEPQIEQMSHVFYKWATHILNKCFNILNKCLSIFVSYINIRQIYFNISCPFYGNCLWFLLWSFGIWNIGYIVLNKKTFFQKFVFWINFLKSYI